MKSRGSKACPLFVDEKGMGASPGERNLLVQKILLAVFVLGGLGGLTWLYGQRHTFTVSVTPGAVASLRVEVPMQHRGGHKSFAKQLNLPVRCTITAASDQSGGVRVSVVETGHGVHKMWALLRVTADPGAAPDRRKQSCAFTIDGQGGWPSATVVVKVTAPP